MVGGEALELLMYRLIRNQDNTAMIGDDRR